MVVYKVYNYDDLDSGFSCIIIARNKKDAQQILVKRLTKETFYPNFKFLDDGIGNEAYLTDKDFVLFGNNKLEPGIYYEQMG